ncbi:MAG: FAD-dependent oxidoreductase [Salaquimonas sp.]
MKNIAVIGSGISGNSAAWALSKEHNVTLFEKDERTGGHSNTAIIDYDGKQIEVDTGFIVYNDHNYPLLTQLFDHLNVETSKSDMSFGVSLDKGKFEWSGQGLGAVFAQRRNLFSPGFLFMLREIFLFNRICKEDLKTGALCGSSFGEYLINRKFSQRLRDDYLVPMTAAIWSTPPSRMLEFPAESLVRFMDNHRLIHGVNERPQWRTVKGGSRQYVDKLLAEFDGKIELGSTVTKIEKMADGVHLSLENGETRVFDEVVIGAHSDQAMRLLGKPTAAQKTILGSIGYKPNKVYLHRDEKLMPKRKAAWSSWNYLGSRNNDGHRDLSLTYWMNRLQNIDERYPLFVSLNPDVAPDKHQTFHTYSYDHPQFDKAAIEAQVRLDEIQGVDNIWYCGAWTKYGFHEDGLSSAMSVVRRLGVKVPFEQDQTNELPEASELPLPLQAAE